MRIRNFLKESFIDYSEKIASVVFSPGCNYKCPTCHSKYLLEKGSNIDNKIFFDYLDSRKAWIEAVVLCGGEPTLQLGLKPFIRKLKERGLAVKLDTNGSQFSVLRELKEEGLIDYVAMDIKGPTYLYPKIVGKDYIDFREDVEKGMCITTQFPDYEFRTTVVPVNRDDGKIDFMTIKEIVDIAKWIVNRTGSNKHKYYLQPFVPREGELIDSRFEEFPETPRKLLEEMRSEITKYLTRCEIR